MTYSEVLVDVCEYSICLSDNFQGPLCTCILMSLFPFLSLYLNNKLTELHRELCIVNIDIIFMYI